MLCTIIIPTLNRPSLQRALKSAFNHDLDPEQYEIVVVNDSGESLPDYEWLRSPQIKIVDTNRCERSIAQTMGAAVGKGKYIKILQDDDYLLPGGLRALIEVAETTGYPWAYGATNRVDDNDFLMSVNHAEVDGNVFAHTVAGDSFHLSASLIRRDAFFQVGCLNPLIHTSEDIDLQWRIMLNGCIARTTVIVASIRVGVWGITSTRWDRKTTDFRKVRENMLNAKGSFNRIRDSLKSDIILRGRCCRAYFISSLLNLRSGNLITSASRCLSAFLLANIYVFHIRLWRGLFTRSHWHRHEMQKEVDHYRELYPDKNIKPQSW
jgi:GT2 family glycosyltransferase